MPKMPLAPNCATVSSAWPVVEPEQSAGHGEREAGIADQLHRHRVRGLAGNLHVHARHGTPAIAIDEGGAFDQRRAVRRGMTGRLSVSTGASSRSP